MISIVIPHQESWFNARMRQNSFCYIPPPAAATKPPATEAEKIKQERDRFKVALENISVCASFPMAKAMAHKALHPDPK